MKESASLCEGLIYQIIFGSVKKLDLQGFRKMLKEIRNSLQEMIEKVVQEHEVARKESKGKSVAKDILNAPLNIAGDESSEVKLSKVNIKAFSKVIRVP